MLIKKNLALNFLGGAWVAVLMVLTTPLFVARLGLEGYGLIGFWLLLLFVSPIFDVGLGSTLSRELARCSGRQAQRHEYVALLRLFERPVAVIALTLLALIAALAAWLGEHWLSVRSFSAEQVAQAIRWMSISVAAQFVTGFYTMALAGLHRQGVMVAVQVVGNSLRYAGGVLVIVIHQDVVTLFVYQAVVGAAVALWAALAVRRTIAGVEAGQGAEGGRSSLGIRQFAGFSTGMFLTALFSAGVSYADRLVVSKMLPADMLGRYTVAVTVIGLLQMFIFAFHRVYQPRFTQLHEAGDQAALRRTYYQACITVGSAIIPTAALFVVYAPQVFQLWLGWTDADTTLAARCVVVGYVMAGVMWLPASYQQATGWTGLNAGLMAAALVLGVPLMMVGIQVFGLGGAAALMLTHGLLQVTVGLVLMNRVCFPGETGMWYRRVILVPAVLTVPVVLATRGLMPSGLGAVGTLMWLVGASAVPFAVLYLCRRRLYRSEER